MPKYMAYLFGVDGHIRRAEVVECVDDKSAIDAAKQFLDGHDVELWERGRKIAWFDRTTG